jgi:hypothetical protein
MHDGQQVGRRISRVERRENIADFLIAQRAAEHESPTQGDIKVRLLGEVT